MSVLFHQCSIFTFFCLPPTLCNFSNSERQYIKHFLSPPGPLTLLGFVCLSFTNIYPIFHIQRLTVGSLCSVSEVCYLWSKIMYQNISHTYSQALLLFIAITAEAHTFPVVVACVLIFVTRDLRFESWFRGRTVLETSLVLLSFLSQILVQRRNTVCRWLHSR